MVFLKNYEPELLAPLFNMCLKESCFLDYWKVSSLVHVFKNVEERSTASKYRPFSHRLVVSKIFEKQVDKRLADHLQKCGIFLISSMV